MDKDSENQLYGDHQVKEAIEKLAAAIRAGQSGTAEMDALKLLTLQLREANENLVLACVKAKIRQQEAETHNKQQKEFLAMLAHELRNPLAPISAAAELLNIAGHDPMHVRNASEIISRQVRHMTALVDDLLDVSRVTRGLVSLEKQNLDLKQIINSAVEQARPLIEAKHHVLILRIASDHAYVHGDQARLIQVVVNLLNNAAKYTPPSGQITVSIEVDGKDVKLCVSDNGSGIEPSLLPRIFDLFAQGERTSDRSQGGLGLGLALVKNIMALHDGEVRVQSDGLGMGSAFTISLPLINGKLAQQEPKSDTQPNLAAPSLHLMIVDDNADAAHSLAQLLELSGHMVTVKENGKSALLEAAQNPPQVFILDIGLLDLDGYELCRRLHADPATANAVFIALTGYGQAHDRALAKAAGFEHHFTKPIDTKKLAIILSQVKHTLQVE